MKFFFTICLTLVLGNKLKAQQDVTMTITYHGAAVCNYEVSLKHGDVVIAKGNTDNTGTVVFSQAMVMDRNVDLYAQKLNSGGEIHFDIKGWIVLNEDFTYELKMEDILKEITEDSGMPESVFAGSWGLTSLDCK